MKLNSIDQNNCLRPGEIPDEDLAKITFDENGVTVSAVDMIARGEAVCVPVEGGGYRWLFGEELHTELGRLRSGALSYTCGVDPSSGPGTVEIRWFKARLGSQLVKRGANGTPVGFEMSAAVATAKLGADQTTPTPVT